MATDKQKLGDWGEKKVATTCTCPKCKRYKTTRLLPPNFRCADLICDFCGYLSQVKTSKVLDTETIPKSILGAAWAPQSERMDAGIYFPLYLVLVDKTFREYGIYFLASDLQIPEMFIPRKPLSQNAKRAGWQGFMINCDAVRDRFVRVAYAP